MGTPLYGVDKMIFFTMIFYGFSREHRRFNMSDPGNNYQQFLTSLKIYAVETVSTVVALVLLLDLAIKELRPALKRIGEFWDSISTARTRGKVK